MHSSSWGGVFIVLQLLAKASADQEVLEDQPVLLQSGFWHWNWRTLQPDAAHDTGWTKTRTSQNPKLRYTTCSTGLTLTKEPNNWLQSTRLLTVSKINRVDITLEYTITQPCSGRFCTETIDLYVNQSDTYLLADKYPDPITNTATAYKKVGSVSRQSGGIRTETLHLPVNSEYILLAFHDEGGCKVIYSVQVTYNLCPEQTLNNSLVSLPKTLAPANDSEPLWVNGSCTEKSVLLLSGSLNTQCQSDGNWNESGVERRCVCIAGTENTGGNCQDCPYGMYNMHNGGNCSLCPANSESTNDRKSCTCKKTFYRAPDESITESCTGLPSAPRHAIVSFVNQSAVVLEWSPPDNDGGRSDVYYEVECRKPCDEDDESACVYKPCVDEVVYIPDKKRLNATNITVKNLLSFVNYTFVIYAKNGVSAVASSQDTSFTSLNVKTNGSVPEMPLVRAEWLEDIAVARVSWTLKVKNGVIKGYHVKYTREDDSSDRHSNTIEDNEIDFKELKGGKTYKFEVSAVNHIGAGPPGLTTLKVPVDSSGLDTTVLLAVIAVVSALLVISLAILVVLYRRRNTPIRTQPRNQYPSDGSHPGELSKGHGNVIFLVDPASDIGTQNDALYMVVDEESSFELQRNEIKFQKLLGSGNFGIVFKASIGNKVVAVKSLKETATAKDKQDMLKELELMKRLRPHPHVVMLIGCCSCDDPLLIVLEYLPYGDLLGYLRKSRGHRDNYNTGKMPTSKLAAKDLLSFAWMIADGMDYLAKMKVVHRDLAARNVLVGEKKVCKISDFGLARGVEADIYVRGTKARLPVKWMPPESLFHGESSTMSDIWSYGILLWEVFTIGDSPYPGSKANQVASLLETGYRMPRPIHISQELFSIMSECWSEKPETRPTFQWISTAIKRLQNDEKVYINLDVYKDEDYVNFDMFDGH